MDAIFPKVAAALVLLATALYAIPAYAARDMTKRAEDRQLTEQFTPEAQYRLSSREAYAAYHEALQGCSQTGKTDRSCTRDAKKQLQQDLADARQHLHGGASIGGSGLGGSTKTASHAATELAR